MECEDACVRATRWTLEVITLARPASRRRCAQRGCIYAWLACRRATLICCEKIRLTRTLGCAKEDERLVQLVSCYGSKMWSFIVTQMKGRTGKQCRERYMNQLDPSIRRAPWTDEESRIIVEAQAKFGNRYPPFR